MYRILSAHTYVEMIVNFEDAEGNQHFERISVSQRDGRVNFHDGSKQLDYASLEQAILEYVRPKPIEAAVIPTNALEKIRQIKNYTPQFPGYDS